MAAGTTNREMAARLFISEATVKTHLLHIYAKLRVTDGAAAVAEAFNRGLLTPERPERRLLDLLLGFDGRLGLSSDLFLVDPGGEFDQDKPVGGDVEDAQVGDDPLDHALPGVRQ